MVKAVQRQIAGIATRGELIERVQLPPDILGDFYQLSAEQSVVRDTSHRF